jgi:hypothetical protein
MKIVSGSQITLRWESDFFGVFPSEVAVNVKLASLAENTRRVTQATRCALSSILLQ